MAPSWRQGRAGAEAQPATAVALKTAAGPHIPFHSHAPTGKILHLHVNAGLLRQEVGTGAEVGSSMLALHSVVGLTAVDPVAIHADAHA